MWRQSLVRILIVSGFVFLIFSAARIYGSQESKQISPVTLPPLPAKEKIEDVSEKVFGMVAKVLPGISKKSEEEGEEGEVKGSIQGNEEEQDKDSEPIEEPVENIQNQTQELIESVKNLPEDQIKAVKRQLFEEFCEDLLREINEE